MLTIIQQRVKIFSLHFGCKFRYEGSIGTIREIGGITANWGIIDKITKEEFRVDKSTLILSPILDLTDVHLHKIAKMYGGQWAKLDREDSFLQIIEGDMCKRYFIMRGDELPFPLVDKLREWGYMVKYDGIDLYEAGVAVKPSLK